MDTHLKQLLNASFDRELTPDEDTRLSNAMQTSLELQEEKKRIGKAREIMKNYQPTFSPYFNDFVMDRIAEEIASGVTRSFIVAFNRIALPLLAAASVLLVFSIFREGGLSLESLIGIESLDPQYLSEFLLFNY